MRDKITIPAEVFKRLCDSVNWDYPPLAGLAKALVPYTTLADVPRLHIHGVRRFDGHHSYHKVYIYLNDQTVAKLNEYGGGDVFLTTAMDWLVENRPDAVPGFDRKLHHITIYLRETIQATYTSADVSRKKDM